MKKPLALPLIDATAVFLPSGSTGGVDDHHRIAAAAGDDGGRPGAGGASYT
jgi:hypothetical protein